MSSIWTPGGEHRVQHPDEAGSAAPPPDPEEMAEDMAEQVADLSPEEQARLADAAEEMAAIRAQLAAAPAEQVVGNHLIGFYELAAIHLGQPTPNLAAAQLAIDALGAVLDACRGRLGEVEATLNAARSQIQLAFVGVRTRAAEAAAADAPDGEEA